MNRYLSWMLTLVMVVSAFPTIEKRQNGANTLQNQAFAIQQQQALARIGAQQVSENVYRVIPTDPGATYSSALIILMPKEAVSGTVGDLARLTGVVSGMVNNNGRMPQAQSLSPTQAATAPIATPTTQSSLPGTTAQAPPAQALPAQAPPAQALPAQALPAQALPAQAPPAQAPPAQTVPAQGSPTQSNSAQKPTPAIASPVTLNSTTASASTVNGQSGTGGAVNAGNTNPQTNLPQTPIAPSLPPSLSTPNNAGASGAMAITGSSTTPGSMPSTSITPVGSPASAVAPQATSTPVQTSPAPNMDNQASNTTMARNMIAIDPNSAMKSGITLADPLPKALRKDGSKNVGNVNDSGAKVRSDQVGEPASKGTAPKIEVPAYGSARGTGPVTKGLAEAASG